MEFSDFMRGRSLSPSSHDELIYEFIAQELADSQVKQGLWTKALADSEWNEPKAKSIYVRMRFEQIKNMLLQEIQKKDIKESQKARERRLARENAKEYGLSADEIDYLDAPIQAVQYLRKYRTTKERVLEACSKKRLTAVMKNDVLWVSDKPI